MSIPTRLRERAASTLTRHYDLFGVPQIRWSNRHRGWVRYARCGQWQPNAPDPEDFFAVRADDPATYRAQEYCAQCPVRLLCGDEADRKGAVGVWGGVYRDQHARVAPLCVTPNCLRYRAPAKAVCQQCYVEARAAKETVKAAGAVVAA